MSNIVIAAMLEVHCVVAGHRRKLACDRKLFYVLIYSQRKKTLHKLFSIDFRLTHLFTITIPPTWRYSFMLSLLTPLHLMYIPLRQVASRRN